MGLNDALEKLASNLLQNRAGGGGMADAMGSANGHSNPTAHTYDSLMHSANTPQHKYQHGKNGANKGFHFDTAA